MRTIHSTADLYEGRVPAHSEPVRDIPAENWQQDVPVGAAYDGQSPERALVVSTFGITVTREAPVLYGTAGSRAQGAQGTYQHLMGGSPQRRKLWLAATGAAAIICTSAADGASGNGLRIPPDVAPFAITCCDDLWVYWPGAANGVLSWFAEVDQG